MEEILIEAEYFMIPILTVDGGVKTVDDLTPMSQSELYETLRNNGATFEGVRLARFNMSGLRFPTGNCTGADFSESDLSCIHITGVLKFSGAIFLIHR